MTATNLLAVEDLRVHFRSRGHFLQGSGPVLRAVDGVSLAMPAGASLGLVGESGCGKSTTARAIMGLVRPTGGRILFDGVDIGTMPAAARRQLRTGMQMVFQDPFATLNPRIRIGKAIREPLDIHRRGGSRAERRDMVAAVLAMVGLEPEAMDRFPHEFSGGQRQRIGIARALILQPRLIVADEPVSALDVSVQAQILNLLGDLRRTLGLGYLFISHDLGVIRHMCDQVAVMYRGRIVEYATTTDLFTAPGHPYTRLLLRSIPTARARVRCPD